MSESKPKAAKLGSTGKVDLPSAVFGERFHGSLVHETVRAELAARRRGTAATKTRAQVRGGGTKPWRQKGTGRARAGSIRSPIWTGGGNAFGPTPRRYTAKVNRKARSRALRAALSLHASHETVAVVDASSFKEPSTGDAEGLLVDWGAKAPTLVLLADDEDICEKCFRNLADTDVRGASDVSVAEIVRAASLVLSQRALDSLSSRAAREGESGDGKTRKSRDEETLKGADKETREEAD